jgi:hypothetical protein
MTVAATLATVATLVKILVATHATMAVAAAMAVANQDTQQHMEITAAEIVVQKIVITANAGFKQNQHSQ